MDWISRNSYLVLTVVLFALGLAYTIASKDIARGGLFSLLVLSVGIIYFVLARRGMPSPANPEKRVRRARAAGRPVVVYFYSDFAIVPLLMRPLVAPVEREYRGRCEFIFIDMNHREAAAAAEALDAGLGEYLLFDAAGKPAGKTTRITGPILDALLETQA